MTAWSRRGAWGLVVLVLGTWLVGFVLAAVGVAPSTGTGRPLVAESGAGGDIGSDGEGDGDAASGGTGPQVVLIGIPGLTWDVIDEETTPTLDRLAREGGTGALVLRGTHEVTCAADAWLTVGAGERAATNVEGCKGSEFVATPTSDRPSPVFVEEIVRGGAVDPDTWDRWSRTGEDRALPTELGTLARLAEAGGTCVAAYGAEAVLGAAGADGSAAVSVPPGERGLPEPVLDSSREQACRIHLVSTPPVLPPPGTPPPSLAPGQTSGEADPVPAADIDAAVEEIQRALPSGTTLVVAGLGHTAWRAEAMALIVHPVDGADGVSLSSGSTRQQGLVQLTDVAPTLLQLASVELPDPRPSALAGQPLTVTDTEGHVAQVRDLAAGISLAKSSVAWVLGALATILIPLLVVAGLLRRGLLLAAATTVAMAVPVATFLAGLAPWWRADNPVVVLTALVAGLSLLVAALGWAGPWRRDRLAPAAVVAAVTLAVLGVDMMWSARLGLVSVLGLQPVTAGRFYGQGNVGFGMALGAFLVLAGALMTWFNGRAGAENGSAEHLHRDGSAEHLAHDGSAEHLAQDGSAEHPTPPHRSPSAALAVLLLGAALTVVGSAPWGGADFGGVPAVVVATGLLVMTALGLRWRLRSLLALGVLGVGVAATVMVLDWLRGPGSRTHLGDFVQRVLDGEALGIVARKLDQSLGILLTYPLSWLAVLALVLVALVVARRPSWSASLWRYRGLRPASLAGLVAIALAWALNDSGIAIVALSLTMLIAAGLTVLGRELTRP